MTLRQCLAAAVRNPNNTDRWAITVDEAQKRAILARQDLKPSFSAGGRGIVNAGPKNNATIAPDVSPAPFTVPGTPVFASPDALVSRERARVSIDAQYIVWDAGRRSYNVQAAQAQVAVAKATNSADQLTLLQSTSIAYYNALHAQRGVDAGNAQLVSADENVKDATARYAVGTVTRSDILAATGALDNAKTALKTRETELSTANATLARLIGADPSQPLALTSGGSPDWSAEQTEDDLLANARQASASRQVIEAARTVAVKKLAGVHAGAKPEVALNGEVGWLGYRDMVQPYNYAYSPYAAISASATMPLFDKTRQRASEQEQADEIKLRDIALRQLNDDLREQLAVDIATYKNDSDKVTIAQDTVDNDAKAYDFARARYEIGKSTEQDVVIALQILAVARDQYEEALAERDTAAQNLRWLVGMDKIDDFAPDADMSRTSR